MKKIPHPLMQLIGKKIVNIKRGLIDSYGGDEHVVEAYQFFFDDNTSLAIQLDDPGSTAYAYVFEEALDVTDPNITWSTKLQDLAKHKVESYADERK